jgi:hypothetical protein
MGPLRRTEFFLRSSFSPLCASSVLARLRNPHVVSMGSPRSGRRCPHRHRHGARRRRCPTCGEGLCSGGAPAARRRPVPHQTTDSVISWGAGVWHLPQGREARCRRGAQVLLRRRCKAPQAESHQAQVPAAAAAAPSLCSLHFLRG